MTRTFTSTSLEEPLIFERSSPGKSAYSLPSLDIEDTPIEKIMDPDKFRSEVKDFPEISEVELISHYTRMSTWNYHVDFSWKSSNEHLSKRRLWIFLYESVRKIYQSPIKNF